MDPLVFWTKANRQCVLHRLDGRYELRLRENGRVTLLQTANNEAHARRIATEWAQKIDAAHDLVH